MEKSPSRKANRFSDSQVIPAFYGARRFITQLKKKPPPIPILRQINPVHASPIPLLENPSSYYPPSMPVSSKEPLSLRFHNKTMYLK